MSRPPAAGMHLAAPGTSWPRQLHEGRGMTDTGGRDALALFDSLEPVDTGFMLGHWVGAEFESGHPLDGALQAYHWQGKRFDSAEEVHPLLFRARGGRVLSVNPSWVAWGVPWLMRWPALKSPRLGAVAQALLPLVSTHGSCARLRMMAHRGRFSAALVYDAVPILDVFRRLGADQVLGLMDMKGLDRPFFFVLTRQHAAAGSSTQTAAP